ncbi:MAG: HDOD domain-containing protein [Shewanella sp.]
MRKLFGKIFNFRDNVEVSISKPASQATMAGEQAIAAVSAAKPIHKSSQVTPVESKLINSIDSSAMFYSLLFQVDSEDSGGVANNLEKKVIENVAKALSDPEQIAAKVLKLSSRVIEIDKQLANPECDVQAILKLLQQDPMISIEVLKLCNSPAFRRGTKEVTNLQQALVSLGRDQIRRFVTSSMVKDIIDIKPIYYRRFGAQIWHHSLQVAFLAGEMATDDADTAFLMGLLHDVGKIAIFKILLDQFVVAEVGEQPRSHLFRQAMTSRSLVLSASLMKCWRLPPIYCEELEKLANVNYRPDGGLAAVIWRANAISELSMLYQAKRLDEEQLPLHLQRIDLSLEDFLELHEKLVTLEN